MRIAVVQTLKGQRECQIVLFDETAANQKLAETKMRRSRRLRRFIVQLPRFHKNSHPTDADTALPTAVVASSSPVSLLRLPDDFLTKPSPRPTRTRTTHHV
jgi:hypothetical protein